MPDHPRSLPDHSDSEIVACPTCGMTWFTRALCERCAFRADGTDPDCPTCHGTGDAGLTAAHTCPEPFPYEMAVGLVAAAKANGGAFVSQTTKARVKLGIERGPNA